MAWLAVDADKSEYIFKLQPERMDGFWFTPKSECIVEIPTGTIFKILGYRISWEHDPQKIPGFQTLFSTEVAGFDNDLPELQFNFGT